MKKAAIRNSFKIIYNCVIISINGFAVIKYTEIYIIITVKEKIAVNDI